MNKLLTGLAAAAALSLTACKEEKKTAASPQKVTIGVLPNEATRDLPILQGELEKRLGVPVEIRVPKDYSDLVDRFKRGDVDFAFFTALLFLQAEREANAKALLKKVYGKSEFYYSAIIARADSKIRSLADLKGKKIGFVDPKSTSGFLYPRVLLRGSKLDAAPGMAVSDVILNSEFFGTHATNVKALLDGKIDAAGVWASEPGSGRGAWTDKPFSEADSRKIRVIAVSDPIPNDAFAVRAGLYTENPMLVLRVMEAFIGMGEDPNGALKRVIDADKMATATSRHYDSVRALESLLKEGSK
jgi:phosphonate transport system substrate-binding protein